MCLAGAVVSSWSLVQEVIGSSLITVMTNIFVTEFSETFRKNSIVSGIVPGYTSSYNI